MNVNDSAAPVVEAILAEPARLRVVTHTIGGVRVIDCGVDAVGGLEAGRRMALVGLAGLGEVTVTTGDASRWLGPAVSVRTDHPVAACMASQYAGWSIDAGGYSAMASGPFRAAAGREAIFSDPAVAPFCTPPSGAVAGILEASRLPPAHACRMLAEQCGVPADRLTLLVAPTDSQAGSLQVVARCVETALHKLHELGFDLARIESAWGAAPLAPVAGDPRSGVGRTNDAVLYGGEAILYARGDDTSLADAAARGPSSSSPDHGLPFAELLRRAGGDFYQMDKLLFSPAVLTLINLDTGRVHRGGRFLPELLAESFGEAPP